MTQRFQDKVVWISGAARGIGKGIAEYFSDEGAKVAIVDINRTEGSKLSQSLRENGGNVHFFHCDLNNEESIKCSVSEVADHFGGLHVMVNNGAINIIKMLHEYSAEEWDLQMSVNLKSCFLSFKYAYPFLKKNEKSYVVNMGSVSSFVGQARTTAYSVTKAGILMLTKSIAIDYAADGIRCNAVCPGITDTPLLREHIGSEEQIQKRLGRVPIGRILTPGQVARAVAYLSCEDSDGITGTNILIDGGYLATAEWYGGPIQ